MIARRVVIELAIKIIDTLASSNKKKLSYAGLGVFMDPQHYIYFTQVSSPTAKISTKNESSIIDVLRI